MSDVERRWRAAPRAIHTRTPRGGVLLDPVAKAYFTLNATGEVLWRALEGTASEGELVVALCREFEVDESQARLDVARWIEELAAADLVQPDLVRPDAGG